MRGEIWTVAGSGYVSKPRPALVIQDDRFNAIDSVTVVPLTSTLNDAPLLRIPIEPSQRTGLTQTSQLMIDKMTTVPRVNVRHRIGHLTAAEIVQVERALLVFIGIN
ncbi:type II toxin-antitoxin system PemK/MazF family toxin [Acaricomes phytoseiuli]|uniref:type II toxin-antitoxin system PemK/MazF family toxin n=1 Tax=Acaricomes phytoseiuli TaxID=291968 RepID=UPI0005B9B184|nr:type II toxin-antitoxin system PemK/MazF family toxin [Acaricomes phytoseiuli]